VDDGPAIAGNDVDGLDGCAAAFGMEEFQCDVPRRADVDPMVFPVDPQGGLIHMHGGLGEELFDGRLLPGPQGVMQLHEVLQEGRLGDGQSVRGWSVAPA
jgi:hypothetical protein